MTALRDRLLVFNLSDTAVVTGYPDLAERSRREGIRYHFLKPVHPDVLLSPLRVCAKPAEPEDRVVATVA